MPDAAGCSTQNMTRNLPGQPLGTCPGLSSLVCCGRTLKAAVKTASGFNQPEPPAIRTTVRFKRPSLFAELENWREFGTQTRELLTVFNDGTRTREVRTYVNEFWTARQRQANSLHEVSYRACFKPQLPRFFIERLTQPGDVVYDPFMGRGTTPIEAALMGRIPFGNDINPLSLAFTRPRLQPPQVTELEARLREINFADHGEFPKDLLVFYHPETLREICALQKHFLATRTQANQSPQNASVDDWLCMVALNRLTGHSPGFFSVYTLPPNQAVSVIAQRKINQKRNQTPPRRHVAKLILKKSQQLLRGVTPETRRILASVGDRARFTNAPADATPGLPDDCVSLVLTSPPFLDVIQYADDNWLRCWFLGIDPKSVQLTVPKKIDAWRTAMTAVFRELHRVVKPGGHVAFEVGEVHNGATKLEEHVLPCGVAAGFAPVLVLINDQRFTKTANCWGVDNMSKGTNSNRIVLFQKPQG